MEYDDAEEEIKRIYKANRKRKIKRKIIAFVLVVIMFVSMVTAITYYDIILTWISPGNEPRVWLLSPPDDSTVSSNPIRFNWSSIDGDGDSPLGHVWYCDVSPTFISPYRMIVDVGVNTSYNITLDDGDWYWKVSVTDYEDGINTSEVWHLIVGENVTNSFPTLSNPSASPVSGYSNATYFYNVTYTDLDNTTPAYIRVYIDGSLHVMVEVDPLDNDTTDGKDYTYNTTISIGTHNYTFTCSDGDAINITDVYTGPTVTSTPAVQGAVVPPDGGVNISINPQLYVNCSDYDGDTMNATWWWLSGGVWYQFGSNSSFTNENITQLNGANFSVYNTTYTWSLNLTDGTSWTNSTYTFTTSDIWINRCPVSSNPSPANNSHDISLSVGYWNITIYDADGNTTNGSIECSCGNSTTWISQGNGVRSLEINMNLSYGITYVVWINFTDGDCAVNETYYFTTVNLFVITLIMPENGSSAEIPGWVNLGVTIAEQTGSLMNLTFYSNLSGAWVQYGLVSGFNGTYYISVPYFNIYNYTYYWNVSVNDGASVGESPVWNFRTVETPDDVDIGGGGGGSYSWIIAIIIIFLSLPLALIVRGRRKRKRW